LKEIHSLTEVLSKRNKVLQTNPKEVGRAGIRPDTKVTRIIGNPTKLKVAERRGNYCSPSR
jgi:hypothetical protein